MPQVFALRTDWAKFQVLELGLPELLSLLPRGVGLNNLVQFSYQHPGMTSWWRASTTRFLDYDDGGGAGQRLIPDICVWADSTLIVSARAYAQLSDVLEACGECIPLTVGQEAFYIFIGFVYGEMLEQPVLQGRGERGAEGLAFRRGADDMMVFKSMVQGCVTLCASERFKQLVEQGDLNGLIFDAIV